MTQEEFIKVLDKKDYSYKIERDRIIVTHEESVDLELLTSIPHGVVFNNGGYVYLNSLTSFYPGVVFNNDGKVYLGYLIAGRSYGMDGWLDDWKCNIKGIDNKRLLNVMISKGIFER